MAKPAKCRWSCGRDTKNISRICDGWRAAALSRSQTDDGYKEWLERKQSKAAKVVSESRKAHLQKARAAKASKRPIELPTSEFSEPIEAAGAISPFPETRPLKRNFGGGPEVADAV
jgi:hypothetical protein